MSDRFRLATAQSPIVNDVRENGTAIRALMRQAAAAGARLVHFPEGAASGYPSGDLRPAMLGWAVDWAALREELEATAALSGELGIWTVVGANHPLTPPNRPHNSLYVISDRGEIAARYDKRLLSFTEVTDWYAPGTAPLTFAVDGFRFGCALCIEIQFQEVFLEYGALGVDVLLLSSFSRDPMFAVQAQGHAACNTYWISFSVPAQCSDAAPSGLIGPGGQWIARCPDDRTPGLTVNDLDRAAPDLDMPLHKARPWRARARSGELHNPARVSDPRSDDRNSF